MDLLIAKMSTAEKLDAMERLWNSLQSDSTAAPVPHWHADILAARRERFDRGEMKFSDIESVRERVERVKR